jgi:PncC family amidohydrolase
MATPEDPYALAERLGRLLAERGEHLVVTEGATGGALANLLTQVPGSSAWFRAGIVAYTDFPKQLLLRVSTETLAARGGISAEATLQMARLARRLFGADWAVAVTGYADDRAPAAGEPAREGPAVNPPGVVSVDEARRGPTPGLTYLAVAGSARSGAGEAHAWEERLLPAGDRASYKLDAAVAALEMLLAVIEG